MFEQSQRVHKRQLADQLSAAKTYQSEKESLHSKVINLEQELHSSHRRSDELLTENGRISKELDRANSRLEESVHQFK